MLFNRLFVPLKPFKRYLDTYSIKNLLNLGEPKELTGSNDLIRVIGWVKSFRDQKEVKFLSINDGSDQRTLQLVLINNQITKNQPDIQELFHNLSFNTSIEATGVLVKSANQKQNVELQVHSLQILNTCEPNEYPFKSKAAYSLEQIRPHVHLRAHINEFANIMRFRSKLALSFHEFFDQHKFVQINTPIITANNCEGGCETFQVVTNEEKSFFSSPAYLTASAQLHLETMTTTLSKVYTLSPTFRAEKSDTRHHLAEFYMLEAELVDMNNIGQLLDFTEALVKTVISNVCAKFDAEFFENFCDTNFKNNNKTDSNRKIALKNHIEFILALVKKDFVRLSYTEAIELLNTNLGKRKKIVKKRLQFGDDLNKEEEKLLVELVDNKPVFVINYPRSLKPFYMRQSDEHPDLVDNFDLLVPNVGEIVGGSLREYRLDLLREAMLKQNLNLDCYKSYLETKKFGSMKMGGFGLGFER